MLFEIKFFNILYVFPNKIYYSFIFLYIYNLNAFSPTLQKRKNKILDNNNPLPNCVNVQL